MLFHKGAEISFSIVSLALCLRESVFTVEISLQLLFLFSVSYLYPEFRSDGPCEAGKAWMPDGELNDLSLSVPL